VKAYYACVVHFPKTAGNTFWKNPWYIGPTALDRVAFITRQHPELGMRLQGGRVRIKNGFDDDIHNDIYEIDPGKIVPVSPEEAAKRVPRIDVSKLAIKRQLGRGNVVVKQFANGHWQLYVDNRPYIIRGISYNA